MQRYFCGVVNTEKHSQILQVEMVPTGTSTDASGVVSVLGWRRDVYTGEYTTRTFVFEGVPVATANSLSGSVAVADIDGSSYNVKLTPYVTDGSSGSAIFEKENNAVSVRKISPHMCRVEVVNRTGVLKLNGKSII